MLLNFDVLFLVMALLPRGKADLLAFMRTCRTMYKAGIPHLLRYYPCYLWKEVSAISFCRFMLVDVPSRFRYLRELNIHLNGRLSPTTAQLLAEVLKHANHVEKLHIDHCEQLLKDHPSLSSPLAQLPNIHTLDISDGWWRVAKLLKRMKSNIVKMHASFLGSMDMQDPAPILAGLSSSLDDLHVTWASFESQGVQFDHLKMLYIEITDGLDMRCLMHTFPNLQDFWLFTTYEDSSPPNAEEREEWCQANILAQLNQRWTSLDTLQGNALILYMLGITYHVRHLSVDGVKTDGLRWLHVVLSDIRPTSLSVRVYMDYFNSNHLSNFLDQASQLKHLKITIHVGDFPPEDVVGSLITLLQSLPELIHVDIELNWRSNLPYIMELEESEPEPEPTALYFEQMDQEVFARQIADASPSLEVISLDIPKQPNTSWKVTSANGTGSRVLELVLNVS